MLGYVREVSEMGHRVRKLHLSNLSVLLSDLKFINIIFKNSVSVPQ